MSGLLGVWFGLLVVAVSALINGFGLGLTGMYNRYLRYQRNRALSRHIRLVLEDDHPGKAWRDLTEAQRRQVRDRAALQRRLQETLAG